MLIRYLTGEAYISFDVSFTQKAFSIISAEDVPFRNVTREADRVGLYIPLYRKKGILKRLETAGIAVTEGELRGLPSVFFKYRKRVCIPLGCLLAALMVWMSGRVIWCVDIEGNSTVSDRKITELLADLGCGVGDTYDDIDFDTLHNRFLIESEGIAWIAVNMNGTHANVEVRETVEGQDEQEDGFYNIVAKESGQIERLAATEGKPVVEIGDTVLRGELLISGAISYKEDTMSRFESAAGSVYASVNRTFEVNIPLKQEIKELTGEKISKKTVSFFDFDINLFRNSSIPYAFCDKISVYKQIYLFDSVPLPLYTDSTVYSEYKIKEVTVTKEEAEKLAKTEYRKKLSEVLSDASILSKTVTEDFDGQSYTISCELYCLADIAQKVPLEIEKREETEN